MYNIIKDLKDRRKFSLTPVKIYLDDIEEIFKLLYEYFDEKDLIIESSNYIYKNFDELARSTEDIIKKLKISTKKEVFSVSFNNSIEIKFVDENLYGLAFKIFYILKKNRIKLQSFLYHFYNYYALSLTILYFSFIYYFRHLSYTESREISRPLVYIVIFYLLVLIYFIFFFLKKEGIVYSRIILHWKIYWKRKFKKDFSWVLDWLKILIPAIITIIFGYLTLMVK